jgi:hypothetical protein
VADVKLVAEYKLEQDPDFEVRVTKVEGCGEPDCSACAEKDGHGLWVIWLGRGSRWVYLDALDASEFALLERVRVATEPNFLPTLRRILLILGAPWQMVMEHRALLAGRQADALRAMDDAFLELLGHPNFPEEHLSSLVEEMGWPDA